LLRIFLLPLRTRGDQDCVFTIPTAQTMPPSGFSLRPLHLIGFFDYSITCLLTARKETDRFISLLKLRYRYAFPRTQQLKRLSRCQTSEWPLGDL